MSKAHRVVISNTAGVVPVVDAVTGTACNDVCVCPMRQTASTPPPPTHTTHMQLPPPPPPLLTFRRCALCGAAALRFPRAYAATSSHSFHSPSLTPSIDHSPTPAVQTLPPSPPKKHTHTHTQPPRPPPSIHTPLTLTRCALCGAAALKFSRATSSHSFPIPPFTVSPFPSTTHLLTNELTHSPGPPPLTHTCPFNPPPPRPQHTQPPPLTLTRCALCGAAAVRFSRAYAATSSHSFLLLQKAMVRSPCITASHSSSDISTMGLSRR